MKKEFFGIILILLLTGMLALAFRIQRAEGLEPPMTEWSRTYGGAGNEEAYEVIQTSDGGYAIVGMTTSTSDGRWDGLLVKTDANGIEQWNETYGGIGSDEMLRSIVQTADGGYALAGALDDPHYADVDDFLLVKTDSSGNHEWNGTYGGPNWEFAHSVVQTSDGGYAMAGVTRSFGAGNNDFWLVKTDSSGNHEWNRTYGGAGNEEAYSAIQTNDGGYALVGFTESFGAGGRDVWLVKTDSWGIHEWNRTHGEASHDQGLSVIQKHDGGYAIAGHTRSFGASGWDWLLLTTNSSGYLLWYHLYSEPYDDYAHCVRQTCDGGYVIAGSTQVSSVGGDFDGWLVRTDASGNHEWNQTYSGVEERRDALYHVTKAWDGGYALAGYSGLSTQAETGYSDFWLIKLAPEEIPATVDIDPDTLNLKSMGQWITAYIQLPEELALITEWNKTYGGYHNDYAFSVVQTPDGGYTIAGFTNSFGSGGADFWLVKTNESGDTEWSNIYGGPIGEKAYCVVQTKDGGYAIAGRTRSFGAGKADFWLVKTDENGNHLWNKTYGGTEDDVGRYIVQTCDCGFAIAGRTMSFGAGGSDFWLVKTDSAGNMQWNKTYGGTADDRVWSLVRTRDCGFAIAGQTKSFGAGGWDFWLVKTDQYGNMEWNKTYGGANDDEALPLIQTSDGGYAIAGYTESIDPGNRNLWLIKTDDAGTEEWNVTYGGPNIEVAVSLVQTHDGKYVVAGKTMSFGAGGRDVWLVKMDQYGNIEWDEPYGGTEDDEAYSLIQTVDGGYAIVGYTGSYGAGGHDFWLIKLSTRYSPEDINASTILLNETFSVDPDAPIEIGDYDSDGVSDLMVKFDRTELTSYIYNVLGIKLGNVTLTVSGQLNDGTLFEGTDTIRVIFAGDINGDGKVNIIDMAMVGKRYGTSLGDPLYHERVDSNSDGNIDILDLAYTAFNYGATTPE